MLLKLNTNKTMLTQSQLAKTGICREMQINSIEIIYKICSKRGTPPFSILSSKMQNQRIVKMQSKCFSRGELSRNGL